MRSGVYKIVCAVTGRCYIGSSKMLEKRWEQHVTDLQRGRHFNNHLQRAWLKHGQTAFSFHVVEHVPPNLLLEHEQRWISETPSLFNINPIAQGGPIRKGMRNAAEHNRKIAESHTGKKHTPEARAKMRTAKLGKPSATKGTKRGPSWNKGRPWTTQERSNLRAAHLGATLPIQQRLKIAESLKRAYAEGRRLPGKRKET